MVRSLKPVFLRGTLEQGGKENIAVVVEVLNPGKLCRAIQCTKLFESRRTSVLKTGLRGILVFEVESDCGISNAQLLWGSDRVLVLQSDRKGSGLWQLVQRDGNAAFELLTEATHGEVTKIGDLFYWSEEPDH